MKRNPIDYFPYYVVDKATMPLWKMRLKALLFWRWQLIRLSGGEFILLRR